MNAVVKTEPQSLAITEDEALRVLGNSLYPGARPDSIRLVLAWCKATGRDVMKKPIHIVPMWVKDAATGKGEMRDTLMPGIGTYRSDAASTGQYAGKSEPEFGPDVTGKVGAISMTYPKWCKVTVQRLVGGQVRGFTALEYWLENYATAGRDQQEPNAMWRKRPYGQLAKCAESQALRMAFPDETGNTNTQEEMEGKSFDGPTIDARPEPDHPKADTYGAEVPVAPKRQTVSAWLDTLRLRVAQCQTADELDHIATSDEIAKAQKHLKNGALDDLNAIMADAMARLVAPVTDTVEPAEDDTFPGDRPLPA